MKIISGGQTGVDRAALDAAIGLGINHGGWCPKGRIAELGTTIPEKYSLKETESSDYAERTILNIESSDGTLVLVQGLPITCKGTKMTVTEAEKFNKPVFILNLSNQPDLQTFIDWVLNNNIKTLNVAGPRESNSPGIHDLSVILLKHYFSKLI